MREVKSPGKNKRRQLLLANVAMKKKKLEQSPNDVILTSDIIPSTITATSTSNIKFTTSLPVTLSNPSSIIQNISTVPHILATSNIPTVSSIPSTSKFVTNIKNNISIRTAEKATSTRDLNSELLNQILQLRNQTKFIKTLQKRITEVQHSLQRMLDTQNATKEKFFF